MQPERTDPDAILDLLAGDPWRADSRPADADVHSPEGVAAADGPPAGAERAEHITGGGPELLWLPLSDDEIGRIQAGEVVRIDIAADPEAGVIHATVVMLRRKLGGAGT